MTDTSIEIIDLGKNPEQIPDPPNFVRKPSESGSVRSTNDPRDFRPAIRENGEGKLNARGDVRGELGSPRRRAFEALKQSMRERAERDEKAGNSQPIGVKVVNTFARQRDKTLPRGWVVFGERRWAAACDLFAEGIEVELKYIVVPEDANAVTEMALENLCRDDLTQIEKSAFVKRLREEGKSTEEICKICGRSSAWVEQMELLSSDRVSSELHEAAASGEVATDLALDMARSVEPSQQGAALRHILNNTPHKADRKAALRELTGRGGRPGKKQVRELMTRIAAAEIPARAKVELSELPLLLAALLDWTTGKRSNKLFKSNLTEVFGDTVDLEGVFAAPSSFNKREQKRNGKGKKHSKTN
jgi:ParB-like chromosome segregation protein Spo0J